MLPLLVSSNQQPVFLIFLTLVLTSDPAGGAAPAASALWLNCRRQNAHRVSGAVRS